MSTVKYVDGPHIRTFAEYDYNQNSQISTHYLANGSLENKYTYNSRNWVTAYEGNKINYGLTYFQNGNISNQYITGEYQNYLGTRGPINFNYSYDKSNRLLSTQYRSGHDSYPFTGLNSYDHDGNFLSLTRSNNGDAFNYEYYSGTNRLSKISGHDGQYTYDYNGNMITDNTKHIYDIKYDYRNLITEFKREIRTQEETQIYKYQYRYNEAGNRIMKFTQWFKGGEDWVYINKEYYIREVSGREIAVYNRSEDNQFALKFWNVWGLSNEGQITADDNKYYYLKDHLGSIRAIYDQNLNLTSAQDYDAWGYELTNRIYNDTNKYKFTSKERDVESSYDYFGARFYDSRIGRWLQMEPYYNFFISKSPYIISFNNPLLFKDNNGTSPENVYIFGPQANQVIESLEKETGLKITLDEFGKVHASGTPNSNLSKVFLQAVNDQEINVSLFTTNENFVYDESGRIPLFVGACFGSYNSNGSTNTIQIFNLDQAKVWEEAGGSSVGLSALHEIDESYISGKLFPGETSENGRSMSHFLTFLLEGANQFYPKIRSLWTDPTFQAINFYFISKYKDDKGDFKKEFLFQIKLSDFPNINP